VKILLTANKTLPRNGIQIIDATYWSLYIPLLSMGHQVYFYDTVNPIEKDYLKVIDGFKPDIIFACLTGDPAITPFEPIDEIEGETKSGRTKTFNWFCDDGWRFDNFSSKICWKFSCCSTPEAEFIPRYKEIGYDNIMLGIWHANLDLFPTISRKAVDVGFCGYFNQQRTQMFELMRGSGINAIAKYGISYEDMLTFHSLSKIGINFSLGENGRVSKTQLKQRVFEITAAKSLLLTGYHEGIEEFFEIDKEIVVFQSPEEMVSKIKFLLAHDDILNKISAAGHSRFVEEHESKKRLGKILDKIVDL